MCLLYKHELKDNDSIADQYYFNKNKRGGFDFNSMAQRIQIFLEKHINISDDEARSLLNKKRQK